MEKYFDKIEDYLDGNLPPTALADFEQELRENELLAEQLENHRLAREAVELAIENDLRNQLNELKKKRLTVAQEPDKKEIVNSNSQRIVGLRRILAIAAGIALLIGFFGFEWTKNQYSDAAILANHFTAFEMPNVRGGENGAPLEEGIKAFNAKDYASASSFFSSIPSSSDYYAMSQFYYGQSLYQSQQYADAFRIFDAVAKSGNTEFADKADWYALLTLLADGKGNSSETKSVLARMTANPNHSYNLQAKEIDQQLNSFWRKRLY
jgi:TolA-binding protein